MTRGGFEAPSAPPPLGAEATVRPGSGAMFDRIAARYDLLNRLCSLGIDRTWRRRAVRALELPAHGRALDLATGTGDVAIEMVRQQGTLQVDALDPSEKMIAIGRRKVERRGMQQQVTFGLGEAQSLPYENDRFDGTAIAFGIRNVPDRLQALREMGRVTKAGGRIALLELSDPCRSRLAKLWVHHVVPQLGALLSGAKEYRYLETSIAAFPPASEFARTIESAGLRLLQSRPLLFGVAHLFVATPRKGNV